MRSQKSKNVQRTEKSTYREHYQQRYSDTLVHTVGRRMKTKKKIIITYYWISLKCNKWIGEQHQHNVFGEILKGRKKKHSTTKRAFI